MTTLAARRLRVVHVCPTNSGGTLAGAERYSWGLARAMAEVAEVTLITFGDRAWTEREGTFTVRCLKRVAYLRGQRHNPLAVGHLPEIARADVVHCHQFRTMATDLAILAAGSLRKRVFVTDLGGGADVALSYRLPLWRWVDRFLAISEFNAADLPARLGVPAEVVYGGVDTELFHPPEVPGRQRSVLTVGRLLPHKGIDLLIDALDPAVRLDVVGSPVDGDYADRVRRQAEGRNVAFHADVSDAQLAEMYRAVTVTAIPVLVDGGYTTALESMASGTPVVASRVGSLPELISGGETGELVPAGAVEPLRAALARILGEPAAAARMGAAGRGRVLENFTWARTVQRCMEAYVRPRPRSRRP